MHRLLASALFSVIALALVAGCSKPETPQEVAAAFWQAVADDDAGDVVTFSTLSDPAGFDGYGRNWANAVPSFGRVVIDGDQATIVTRLPADTGPEGERLELTTFLVRTQNHWLVDYQRTGDVILNPSPFDGLMGELGRLKNRLSESWALSSDNLEASMNELARDFEAYSDAMSQQAEDAVEAFGETLQKAMEDLRKSLDDALNNSANPTPGDRAILEQAAQELGDKADALSKPTMRTLGDASRTLAETGERLTHLSRETLQEYQGMWEKKLSDIRDDTEAFFADLHQRFSSEG
jgi:flagellar hook-basal body complex protein FliE